MRATPHYPPPQPNTSARADYYNEYAREPPYTDNARGRTYYYRGEEEGEEGNNYTSTRANNDGRLDRRQRQRHAANGNAPYSASANTPPPQQHQQQQRLCQQQQQPPQRMDDNFSSVVYTVQDTHTDTKAHETDYGGVLTIRTTTVTRTITERLVRSDEDTDSSDDDGEVHLQSHDDRA